jgi:hypothetical protein
MKKILFLLVLSALFFSCGTTNIPTQVAVETKTTIKDKLTPVTVEADSASMKALFECDSLNQVVLRQLQEVKGQNVNSQASFKNGELVYKTIYKDKIIFVHGTDSIIYKEVPVNVPGETIYINELKWWQKVLMWAGAVMFLQIALIIFSLIKTP